ncbi:MAG: hypothetical protein OEZ01_04425 [Candidatus Heimdallarchaeota archaeon]|nr:hypothetical protein [Candidatus Heimdallarchaeota archaeon]
MENDTEILSSMKPHGKRSRKKPQNEVLTNPTLHVWESGDCRQGIG